MKYIGDKLSPSEVKQNVTKTYAYIKCKAGLFNDDNHRQAFRCTWEGTEIYSYIPTVKETVTCLFSGSTTMNNSCTTIINDKSYSCKNTRSNSCKTEIIGKK